MRPAIYQTTIHLPVSKEMHEGLNEISKYEDRTVAYIIRKQIEILLDKYKKNVKFKQQKK